MQAVYDKSTDILMLYLSDAPVDESDEERPGIIMDYDIQGNVVAIEILDASKRVSNPEEMRFTTMLPTPVKSGM